jgi:hypothetical protein
MKVQKLTNKQNIEALQEVIEISQKPANPWKRKMVDKISQLLMVMSQGEGIEEKYEDTQEKGLYPNWEAVYKMYVGEAPVDKIKQ